MCVFQASFSESCYVLERLFLQTIQGVCSALGTFEAAKCHWAMLRCYSLGSHTLSECTLVSSLVKMEHADLGPEPAVVLGCASFILHVAGLQPDQLLLLSQIRLCQHFVVDSVLPLYASA